MIYILFGVLGVVVGGTSVYFALDTKRKLVEAQKRRLDAIEVQLRTARGDFEQRASQWTAEENARLQAAHANFQSQSAQWTADQESRWSVAWSNLQSESARVNAMKVEIEERIVSYQNLVDENSILKRDLRNLDVNVRKLQLDYDTYRESLELQRQKVQELGARYLKENVKWLGASLTPNNFVTCKQRLLDVIERCRGIGFDISAVEEAALVADLRSEYELVVRQAFEREEQARIKAQIREEQLREREIDRELKQLEREREAIRAALEVALKQAQDQHSEEVERLQVKLTEAEERSQRAIAQAQLTKSGFVYVLSNVGSFGDNVFKVGMSRRLDPLDRVRELSGAAVPFPFDVHAMIATNDAPSLENALHRKLHRFRVNKANPRKEYLKIDIGKIFEVVKEHHGEVQYVADAEALQFRQSITMSEEDQEFIETVYDKLEGNGATIDDDD
jgi:hypothetical protein